MVIFLDKASSNWFIFVKIVYMYMSSGHYILELKYTGHFISKLYMHPILDQNWFLDPTPE